MGGGGALSGGLVAGNFSLQCGSTLFCIGTGAGARGLRHGRHGLFSAKQGPRRLTSLQGLSARLQGWIQDFGTEGGPIVEDFEMRGQSRRSDAKGVAGESVRRD